MCIPLFFRASMIVRFHQTLVMLRFVVLQEMRIVRNAMLKAFSRISCDVCSLACSVVRMVYRKALCMLFNKGKTCR